MANLVTISDYVGDFQLQQDLKTETKFDSIRDEIDRPYIRQLLGVELGNLFLTNFDDNSGVPTGRYLSIYEALQFDDNGFVIESLGIKYMIKGIVWFHYARQNNVIVSTGGNKAKKSENSTPANESTFYVKNHNAAVRTGKAIQRYIEKNSSTYPEYNGQFLDYIF